MTGNYQRIILRKHTKIIQIFKNKYDQEKSDLILTVTLHTVLVVWGRWHLKDFIRSIRDLVRFLTALDLSILPHSTFSDCHYTSELSLEKISTAQDAW